MKMVRYHHLVEKLLKEIDQIKIIGIVRNPCAVINSWFKAPREFNKEWDPLEEWRYATKNLRLVDTSLPITTIKAGGYRCLMAPIGYIFAVLLGFVEWRLSMVIFISIPFMYILPFGNTIWLKLAKH